MAQISNTQSTSPQNAVAHIAVSKRRPERDEPDDDAALSLRLHHMAIAELISQLKVKTTSADDETIGSALIIREIRRRVEDGELGNGSTWYEWALENLDLRKSRLKELHRIAEAKNPRAEMARLQNLACERAKRHGAKNEREPELRMRARVAYFAKKGPAEQVRILDNLVCKMPTLN